MRFLFAGLKVFVVICKKKLNVTSIWSQKFYKQRTFGILKETGRSWMLGHPYFQKLFGIFKRPSKFNPWDASSYLSNVLLRKCQQLNFQS